MCCVCLPDTGLHVRRCVVCRVCVFASACNARVRASCVWHAMAACVCACMCGCVAVRARALRVPRVCVAVWCHCACGAVASPCVCVQSCCGLVTRVLPLVDCVLPGGIHARTVACEAYSCCEGVYACLWVCVWGEWCIRVVRACVWGPVCARLGLLGATCACMLSVAHVVCIACVCSSLCVLPCVLVCDTG